MNRHISTQPQKTPTPSFAPVGGSLLQRMPTWEATTGSTHAV